MANRLEQEGFPVYPVPLGSQLGCIDRKAGEISQYLDKHGLEDGACVFVYVVCASFWLLYKDQPTTHSFNHNTPQHNKNR